MAQFKTITKARYLRKEKTKPEEILWEELRNKKLGVKFRRQHPIDMYILDFYAPEVMLSIELDGSTHKTEESKEYDQKRTDYLKQKNITELRFWNPEVENNLTTVLKKIKEKLLFN